MERSHLQRMFNAARFDDRTTYAGSVGSDRNAFSSSLFTHNLPSAGRPSREILLQDVEPDVGNQIDWAGNPLPANRRRLVDTAENKQTRIKQEHGFLAPQDLTASKPASKRLQGKHQGQICLGQIPGDWTTSYAKEYSTGKEPRIEESQPVAPLPRRMQAAKAVKKAGYAGVQCSRPYGIDLRDMARQFRGDPFVQAQALQAKKKSAWDDPRYRKELYADNYRHATGISK